MKKFFRLTGAIIGGVALLVLMETASFVSDVLMHALGAVNWVETWAYNRKHRIYMEIVRPWLHSEEER
jgi:hypothetical protein